MRMAMAVNTLGLPAVAVPIGIGDGLPQVVQVIGPRYREDLCFDAAHSLEERLGIITRSIQVIDRETEKDGINLVRVGHPTPQ